MWFFSPKFCWNGRPFSVFDHFPCSTIFRVRPFSVFHLPGVHWFSWIDPFVLQRSASSSQYQPDQHKKLLHPKMLKQHFCNRKITAFKNFKATFVQQKNSFIQILLNDIVSTEKWMQIWNLYCDIVSTEKWMQILNLYCDIVSTEKLMNPKI